MTFSSSGYRRCFRDVIIEWSRKPSASTFHEIPLVEERFSDDPETLRICSGDLLDPIAVGFLGIGSTSYFDQSRGRRFFCPLLCSSLSKMLVVGESPQIVLKLFTFVQEPFLTRLEQVLPSFDRFHILVKIGEDGSSFSRCHPFRFPQVQRKMVASRLWFAAGCLG